MKRGFVLRRVAEKEFRATVEEYFQRILENPEWFPKVRGEVRRAVVRRFPFAIHFLVETDRIVILSVFHTSRNPEQLKTRR